MLQAFVSGPICIIIQYAVLAGRTLLNSEQHPPPKPSIAQNSAIVVKILLMEVFNISLYISYCHRKLTLT